MKKLIILALAVLSLLVLTSCGKRDWRDTWVDIVQMPTPTYTTEIYCTDSYCCENTKKWSSEVDYSKAYNVDCVAIPGYSGNCEGHIHYVITWEEYK